MDYRSLAETVSEVVDSLTFDFDKFSECMHRYVHRTLQQRFTKLCFNWIRYCASDLYGSTTDGRNVKTHEACKKLVSTMDKEHKDWDSLPLI